jgi:hypothetical protein
MEYGVEMQIVSGACIVVSDNGQRMSPALLCGK